MNTRPALSALLASSLAFAGCFGGGPAVTDSTARNAFPAKDAGKPSGGPPSASLESLASNSKPPTISPSMQSVAAESDRSLDYALAQASSAQAKPRGTPPGKQNTPRSPLNDTPEAAPTTSPVEAATNVAAAVTAPTVENAAAALPLEQRIEKLSVELAKALRERGLAQRDPAHESIELSMLEAFTPAAATVTEPNRPRLDAGRLRSVQALRAVIDAALRDPQLLAEPARFCDAVVRAIEPIEADRGLRLARMEFCSRVDGYGQFEAMGRKLLGGRSHQAIVYAEIEGQGFRSQQAADGSRYTVDLGQTVELYTDSDKPVLQMRRPEESITETSRNHRRDFFILDVIELPQTLSVGAYKLKITVRDRIGGGQVEQWLPIEIVADAKLATANH